MERTRLRQECLMHEPNLICWFEIFCPYAMPHHLHGSPYNQGDRKSSTYDRCQLVRAYSSCTQRLLTAYGTRARTIKAAKEATSVIATNWCEAHSSARTCDKLQRSQMAHAAVDIRSWMYDHCESMRGPCSANESCQALEI